MSDTSIAAIMVTYNRSQIVMDAIKCLQLQTIPLQNIVVVDNSSIDDTINVIESLQEEDKRIQIIKRPDNGGYASGLHTGLLWAEENLKSDYYWLMDDDSYPVNNALELLLNNIQISNFDMLGLTGFRQTWTTKKTINPDKLLVPCDYILIDNALLKSSIVKHIGTPNPDFFMMCEDYEYCLRLRKADYKIGILKNDHVNRLHLGSSKFSVATSWRGYYHARNHMLILKKYFTIKMLVNYILIQFKYLINSIAAKDRWMRIRLRLIGIYHGLISIKGKTLDPKTLSF